jgi:uracil-DNA glycosylase family 4
MQASGEGRRGIMIINEAPCEQEDRRGKQLIGPTGQILRQHLSQMGMDVDVDCRIMSAVSCYSSDSDVPTKAQVEACRPIVMAKIEEFKPKVIILLGATAVESVLGGLSVNSDDANGGIALWRGWRIPDQRLKCWVCPIFHPSFLNRDKNRPDAAEVVFHNDLEHAIDIAAAKFPLIGDVDSYLEYDLSDSEVIDRIKKSMKVKEAAFDYETTGLKPHRKGHEVVYASICDAWNHSYSFRLSKSTAPYLKEFLDSDVGKIGANIQFEAMWSRQSDLEMPVRNWIWDVNLAAHILDNRSGVSGLKFQTYVNFGLPDYSHSVGQYFESNEKGGNAFNRIFSAPKRTVLKYNAIDSLVTLWLKKKQMEEIHA